MEVLKQRTEATCGQAILQRMCGGFGERGFERCNCRIPMGLEFRPTSARSSWGQRLVFRHTGADDVDSIQRGFGGDSVRDPIELETMVLDGQHELPGHLELVHDAHPDLVRADQRPGLDPGAHLVLFFFRGDQQRLPTTGKKAEAPAIASLLIALVNVVHSLDFVGIVFVEVFQLRRWHSIQEVKCVAIPVQILHVTWTYLVRDLVPGLSQFGFPKCS